MFMFDGICRETRFIWACLRRMFQVRKFNFAPNDLIFIFNCVENYGEKQIYKKFASS